MNARLILAPSAAMLLAVATATFAQSATTPSPASPAAWSEATVQRPATAAPRPSRGSGYTLESDQQAPTAQAGTGQATAAPQAPRMTRPQRGQLINVKVEFTITDQLGTKPPIKKTMTMVVADTESSRIRTNANYKITRPDGSTTWGRAPLSVDVSPSVEGNKVRVEFSIEYSAVDEAVTTGATGEATVSERLVAVLESGIPMVVAQSSDAVSDRKITVEIKATILR
ncbi:MAG: hypothetical protein Q7V01_04870 [Vicinamibacterales bacterium]|nr:hypothetical protein [Vicinamibacterales bacterium]